MSILEALICIVRFPYEAAKKQSQESILGQSEWDKKSVRFWKWFAWTGTSIIVGIPLALWIAWLLLVES